MRMCLCLDHSESIPRHLSQRIGRLSASFICSYDVVMICISRVLYVKNECTYVTRVPEWWRILGANTDLTDSLPRAFFFNLLLSLPLRSFVNEEIFALSLSCSQSACSSFQNVVQQQQHQCTERSPRNSSWRNGIWLSGILVAHGH